MSKSFFGEEAFLYVGEEAEEFCIDFVDDFAEVLWVVLEVHSVGFDDEHAAFVAIEDKILVALVEALEVLQLHGLFVLASPTLDLSYQLGYGLAEIDEQVGVFGDANHEFEELHIGLEVGLGEVALPVVVLGEDIDALEDGAVLNDGVVGFGHVEHIAEALFEEEHLHGEGPAFDVAVVVLHVGVFDHGLKSFLPAIMVCEHVGEGGLAGSDISCYCYMHDIIDDSFLRCASDDRWRVGQFTIYN